MINKIKIKYYELLRKKDRYLRKRRNREYNINRLQYDKYYRQPNANLNKRFSTNKKGLSFKDTKFNIISKHDDYRQGRRIGIKSRRNLDCICCLLVVAVIIVGVIGFSKKTTSHAASSASHNFTKDENKSSIFNISGNITDTGGLVTYNNLRLTKSLKMDNTSNVTFTTTAKSKLVLVFDSYSSDVNIDGENKEFNNGIYIGKLKEGTHTITKSSPANLYYIKLSDESASDEDLLSKNDTATDDAQVYDCEEITSDVNMIDYANK